ncbi:hypothetical protein GUJ93_ZPchr0008g13256 [Zizania palustris]|uniref:Uncharacterized protein n=1 Tax=Zizania palustris TaxID=103762 RepID=A0A8J5VI69_ZIZPA|nr:hypothetical protein GUJ93_ZPchr0008g13256 [Zizania palustris]
MGFIHISSIQRDNLPRRDGAGLAYVAAQPPQHHKQRVARTAHSSVEGRRRRRAAPHPPATRRASLSARFHAVAPAAARVGGVCGGLCLVCLPAVLLGGILASYLKDKHG